MARDERVEKLELFAWVGEDRAGAVGLVALESPLGVAPAVTVKRANAEGLMIHARRRTASLRKPVRLVRFVFAEVVQEISPETG